MKAEIIAIGTELLLGQITNTNAQFLSEHLAAIGISVFYHSVVGDNPNRLKAQLEISTNRSDLLIFTGGLGPTQDDLTKETIAAFLGRKLVIHEEGLETIKQFFSQRNVPMTDNNIKQAVVMEGAKVFPNQTGLALGMGVEQEGKHFLFFPGPPKELKPMFFDYALPYLRQLIPNSNVVYSKVLRFCGIGESALEVKLQDLIEQQTNPTIAPLAKEGEVTLRLTSFSSTEEKALEDMNEVITEIKQRVGEYLYGWDNESLESVLIKELVERTWTIACAESCTGGLVSHSLSTVSGASQALSGGVICYTDQVKEEILGIPLEVLEQDGAVSEQTARLLARHVKEKFGTDVGISVTGVAGPTTQEGKPVGLVYVGYSLPNKEWTRELRLAGDRLSIQTRAAKLAMFYLIQDIKKGE